MSTATQEQQHPAGDSAPAASKEDKEEPVHVTFSFNVTSSEEVQARLDAADLAVREAEYEKKLLAHQLEADSHERMRLQAALKELALQHRRVVRAAMAAELEASNLRQQAADASAAASTAQAQAVQAVQSAQQQLALLQAQQQQLPQQYTAARPPYTTGRTPSYSNFQGLNQPFMMGTVGGRRPSQAQASPKSAAQSNADLTEGLFDDMESGPWGIPGGSLHNMFAPELYSYPYGSNYASKKRLSTSSAPGVSTSPPFHPPSGPREQRLPGNTAAEAAGAAAGAAAVAAHATAEEPKSVLGEPQSAARAAAAAAQGTMVQASTRLAADGAVHTGERPSPTSLSTGTDKNTDKNEVSTAQLVDRAPSPVASTEVETAPEEEVEDSVSTTTHVGEGKPMSSDRQRESRPIMPPHTPKSAAIEELPQLEEASQHSGAHSSAPAPVAPSGHPWHSLSHAPRAGRMSPDTANRTSMDVALSEVQGAMGQMYKTQSDDSLVPRLSASPSMQRLPFGPTPSEPDLASHKHEGGPAAIYLPMVGNQHTGGTETPSLASGATNNTGQEQKQQDGSEPVPLRQQLVQLSTCSHTGEDVRRKSGVFATSPPSSTPMNATFGSPGKNYLSSKPGTLRKINSDTHALSASQLLSHSPFSPTSTLHPTIGEARTEPQPGQPGHAFQLESAGSLSEGFVGVAGEAEPLPPVALRASSLGMPATANRMGAPSPFSHCRSFTAHQHSDVDFFSPSRSSLAGHFSYGGAQQQPEPQLSSSLPPGPSLVRPFASVNSTGQPPAVHVRNARSGSVSPGAYGMVPGSTGRLSSGGIQAEAAKPSQLYGAGSFKVWGAPASRPQTRSGVETPHSAGAMSFSRARSGAITPRHPLLAAQATNQSKLDENLHLLQALDKITRDRHKEINEELESVQHEDDLLSHQGFRTSLDKGGQEAARVSKLQEELSRAKAEASRAEAERVEAMRARHEVAAHLQSVLAEQQQKQQPGANHQAERSSRQGSGGTPPGDVCNVIGDEAMRQRCRDLLTDILGNNDGEEQQVPPSYVVAPAAPVAPIHVQQQMNAVQSMLSQVENVVGRLNESLERQEASRAEKEAMERRLANLESKVLAK